MSLILCCAPAWTADSAGTVATPTSHVAVLNADDVVRILDQTVDWYRTLGTQQQNATEPSDLLILFANRQTADDVVALAFEIARANAELLSSEAATPPAAAGTSPLQSLAQQQDELAARRASLEGALNAARTPAGGAARAKHAGATPLPELRDALAMVDAHRNLLDAMTEFVADSNPKTADANALKARIDAIAATIPHPAAGAAAAPATTSATPAAATPVAAGAAPPVRAGLWDLGVAVLRLHDKIATIDLVDARSEALAATFKTISAPPLAQLQALAARGETLGRQSAAATGAALATLRGDFDTLAWLVKQTSAILVPLTREQILLGQYRHNLANWRDATRRQYGAAWSALGLRLGILAGALLAVYLLSAVWRRAVLRLVQDSRRRYELLLVRKLVAWAAVIVIVGLSVVTEISTFATFAGLLTAGLAVAMQSVLLSVVGYFFLIGKLGIRVGDRVQIGAVVGEVIDIGMVRMHLMELNTSGPLGPTGRVVAFANLVVFQASGGLFKQIPGVDRSWHETTMGLPQVGDYAALKSRLLAAVHGVTDPYRDELSRQAREIRRSTDSQSAHDTSPTLRMRWSEGHMEAIIGYPVVLEHASDIDEAVAAAVLAVIGEAAH